MTYYAILRVMTIWQSDKILKEKTGEEDKTHRGRGRIEASRQERGLEITISVLVYQCHI